MLNSSFFVTSCSATVIVDACKVAVEVFAVDVKVVNVDVVDVDIVDVDIVDVVANMFNKLFPPDLDFSG